MAMRLNAAMKQQVVLKAVQATFAKREKDLATEGRAIDRAIWMDCFGDVRRHIYKLIGTAFVNVGNDKHLITAPFNVGGRRTLVSMLDLPYPPKYNYSNDYLGIVKDRGVIERTHAFYDKREALAKEQERVKATLAAMLKNIQTYERLEKEWPEGKKFYQSLPVDFPYQHQVPAVEVKALNQMLGLAA